eukprot:gene3592-4521_t
MSIAWNPEFWWFSRSMDDRYVTHIPIIADMLNISALVVISTSVPAGTSALSFSYTGDNICTDSGCAFTMADFTEQLAACAEVSADLVYITNIADGSVQGDGETCEMCALGLFIQSSTVVQGKVKSALQNQVIGSLSGLEDEACVPSTATTFQWVGSSSDGAPLIKKAGREASAAAQVTMTSGPLPVPNIAALPGKVNANQKLTLSSTVESVFPETVARAWSVTPQAGTAALDLTAAVATALSQADLVVRASSLQVGGAYTFKLSVEDSVGLGSTSLLVVVNSPPEPGSFEVSPLQGTALDTMFQMVASGWVDEDAPLWYQLSYEVMGGASATRKMLNEYKAEDTRVGSMLPEEGLEAAGREVRVYVTVRDSLGAVASAFVTVVVEPVVMTSDTELTSFVDDKLVAGIEAAANGDLDTSLLVVDGLAAAVNAGADERRRRRRARRRLQEDDDADAADAEQIAVRSVQRETMMDLVDSGQSAMVVTDSSLQRISGSVASVVCDPEEVAPQLQSKGFSMMAGVVSEADNPDTDATITAGAAEAVGGALSHLVVAGVVNPAEEGSTTPNPAAQGMGILGAMAETLVGGMVNGEEPMTLDTPVLSMWVQQESLSDPSSDAFSAPMTSPSGSAVRFPGSMGAAVGGGSAAIKLLTSAVDPHVNLTRNASALYRRRLLEEEDGELGLDLAGQRSVSTVGADDLSSLSMDDVLQSLKLLAVLAGFMGGCVVLAWLSNWSHRQ